MSIQVRRVLLILLLLFMLVTCFVIAEECDESGMETGKDRALSDYSNLEVQSPCECRDKCDTDDKCKAWTYVKAGAWNPSNDLTKQWCWLKDKVSEQSDNENCISGVKITVKPLDRENKDKNTAPDNYEMVRTSNPPSISRIEGIFRKDKIAIIDPDIQFRIQGTGFNVDGMKCPTSSSNSVGLITYKEGEITLSPKKNEFIAEGVINSIPSCYPVKNGQSMECKSCDPGIIDVRIPPSVSDGKYLIWVYSDGKGNSNTLPVRIMHGTNAAPVIDSFSPKGWYGKPEYEGRLIVGPWREIRLIGYNFSKGTDNLIVLVPYVEGKDPKNPGDLSELPYLIKGCAYDPSGKLECTEKEYQEKYSLPAKLISDPSIQGEVLEFKIPENIPCDKYNLYVSTNSGGYSKPVLLEMYILIIGKYSETGDPMICGK